MHRRPARLPAPRVTLHPVMKQRPAASGAIRVDEGPTSRAHWQSPTVMARSPPYIEANRLALLPQVYGLPTIILVKDGEKMKGSHHEGAITQAKLVDYLDKHGFAKADA